MSETLPINIVLADRTYRLKVDPAEESMVRKTAELINQKMGEFRLQFAGKDTQDYLAMVLLWFATAQSNGTDALLEAKNTLQSLQELNQLVGRHVES
ncbi:MAG: cell division protein ZapA [Sphingobacteriia bacterium]|nr:MAG: cell division protein ZapA [Sphingobacteriia bacterium]